MITHFDEDYIEAKLVKQGRKSLSYPFDALAAWTIQRFAVPVLNVYYDILKHDDTPRLDIALEFERDVNKFQIGVNFDEKKQAAIASQWKELLEGGLHGDAIEPGLRNRYRTDNVFVAFSGFDRCARKEANAAIPEEKLKELHQRVDPDGEVLWRIHRGFGRVTFFFHTEAQAAQFSTPLLKEVLSSEYYKTLCPYDEFGYFNPNSFSVDVDSKENLDKRFSGSFFYYDR